MAEVVIGIDLGTTYSCVAVAQDGGIEIIANDQGNRTTPSYVAFSGADQDYERLIGESAKNQATLNPGCTFFDVKRLMGKKFNDPEVNNDMKYLPYRVVNEKGNPYVKVNDGSGETKSFSLEEISAMVLGKMKETAESYLGKDVNGAVVTVPAYFNDAQRQATKDAGTIAGLNVVRIVNEPTAGGTFDVSILEIEGNVFQILATGGDTHLGGGDFDQRVTKYFMKLIKRKYRKDVSGDSKAIGKLRKECERAKRALSGQLREVSVNIDYFVNGMDFSEVLTRAKFEELNSNLFEKTLEVVKSTIEDSGIRKSDIDDIVLVGGSTRIPKVREMLRDMFDGKEPCKGVNPDEAVAYGAAVLGAKLSGALDAILYDVTLSDVTPLSLGIDILGDMVSVYQGDRPMTKDCIKLGGFGLSNVTPAPRGDAKIEVTFDIDDNGILTVTAKEYYAWARTESLTITSYKGNLTTAEIERMISEAKKMSKKDKIVKARVEARNVLELFIYDVKKAVAKGYNKNQVSWNEKRKIKAELREASVWLDENRHSSKKDCERRLRVIRDVWNPIKPRCCG
ncbi:Heat shock 70 kDa protein BIP1 [Linum perenne]